MSSSMHVHVIETLTSSSVLLNLYFSLFIFLFGTVGNILNILILTQRSFRSNPCILLFLLSSIANLVSILFGLTPRILSTWEMDLTATNDFFCKLRAFVTFTSRTVALWLILLATIDRWIISSNSIQYRQLSSLKNARKGSLITTIFCSLLYSQMLYCYQANLINTPLKCYGKSVVCRLITDVTYACFTILFPLLLMAIFGTMTISNIRDRHACMEPRKKPVVKQVNSEHLISLSRQKRRWKKLDRYLRRMLLLQIILLIILTLPQAIHKLYLTMTLNKYRSTLENEFNSFLYRFELLLPFLESALPFYIYTLTGGKVFRRALEKLIVCSKEN